MKLLSLTYDLPQPVERVPAPGEVVSSVLKCGQLGSSYLVVTVREVRARQRRPVARFALGCRRVANPPDPAWLLHWYPRGRR